MDTIYGMKIVVNPLALKQEITFHVRPWPIRKRRRSYFVERVERTVPAMIVLPLDNVLVIHGSLLPRLRAEVVAAAARNSK